MAAKENWQLQETVEDSLFFEKINQEMIIVLLAVLNLGRVMNLGVCYLSFFSGSHSTS